MPHAAGRSVLPVGILALLALVGAGGAAWGAPVQLPSGSYQASCRNMSATSPPAVLTGECKNTGGKWVATRLAAFDHCRIGIANFDGNLTCQASPPPDGSYLQSCRFVAVDDGGRLSAECKRRDGSWTGTFLLLGQQKCTTPISNYDGILRCSVGSVPDTGPYTRSCEDIFADGTTLSARCKTRAGQWVQSLLPNFTSCATGSVNNIDGFLTCIQAGQVAPPGSYLATCRNVMAPVTTTPAGEQHVLLALCRLPGGGWQETQLKNVNECRGDIANLDGTLTCVSAKPPAPPGS